MYTQAAHWWDSAVFFHTELLVDYNLLSTRWLSRQFTVAVGGVWSPHDPLSAQFGDIDGVDETDGGLFSS